MATANEMRAYYRDPEIVWIDVAGLARPEAISGGPLPASGYYVIPFCGRTECCRPDGPFPTVEAARAWSCRNAERGERA